MATSIDSQRRRRFVNGRRGFAVLLLIGAIAVAGYTTRRTWLRMGAESLVCASSEATGAAALIDNVEPNYLLFEHAERLTNRRLASSVLVPILGSEADGNPSAVHLGFVEVMCRIAHLQRCITFHAPSEEPISLTLARDSARELHERKLRTVLLVTPAFRSQRALEVYTVAFNPYGIAVHCQPVFGTHGTANWFETTHGTQDVLLQLIKLWYYRLVILPRTS